MAESILVSELQTICRDRTDQQNSTFITDAELLRYINTSYKELYNKLINANSTYFMAEDTINIVSNQESYALPTDFYKVQGVDILVGSYKLTAKPYTFENRNRHNFLCMSIIRALRYIIQGDTIRFVPIPSQTATATLFYIPLPQTVSDGTETLNTVNGGYQFIIADVCRRIAIKAEDTNVGDFLMEKQQAIADIMNNFAIRDEGMPLTVTDAYSLNDYYLTDGSEF